MDKKKQEKKNKVIQDSAKKIISTWPDWKKAYVKGLGEK